MKDLNKDKKLLKKVQEQVSKQNIIEDVADVEYQSYYNKESPSNFVQRYLNFDD